jgi:hypothetical protein
MATPSIFVGFKIDGRRKQASGYFISERRENVEEWIENGGRRSEQEPARKESPAQGEQAVGPEAEANPFEMLSRRFMKTMNQYDRIVPTTLGMLPFAELFEINKKFYEPIARGASSLTGESGFELYKVPFDQFRTVDRAMDEIRALRRGRTSLPGMFLMGLISSYDSFLAELVRLIFLTQPELISSSDKNISFKDLVDLGTVDAARNHIIEKEVETFLRQSHHAHFEYLEAKLKIPLRKDLAIWPAFVEICERRNLFTHTGGVVSSQYTRVCTDHDVDLGATVVGDQLTISREYLTNATEIVSELGLKLVHVVWRKLNPKAISTAASALNHQAFELLTRQRYKLAQVMLEFGLNLKKHGDELTRKMMVVNLAIAFKQQGDKEAAIKILDNEDWSAASDQFRICVAAVREDMAAVLEYLPKVAAAGEIEKADFRDWPAFLSVKDNPEFIKAFEKAFGESFVPDRSSSEELALEDKTIGEVLPVAEKTAVRAPTGLRRSSQVVAKKAKAGAQKAKTRKTEPGGTHRWNMSFQDYRHERKHDEPTPPQNISKYSRCSQSDTSA